MSKVNEFYGANAERGYLKNEQYATADKLKARARLHQLYSTNNGSIHAHLTKHTPWADVHDVLEVGVGPGWWWQEAVHSLPTGASLTVTDLTEAMVEEATQRCVTLGLPVRGRVLNVDTDPIDSESFDLIAAHYMLYHVADIDVVVTKLAHALRVDGSLVAASNGSGHLHELLEISEEVFGINQSDRGANGRFSPEEGGAVLRSHFAEVQWHRYEDALMITSADDVLAYLCSFPPGDSASPQQVRALEDAIARRMDSGVFRVEKETGMFVAKRPLR